MDKQTNKLTDKPNTLPLLRMRARGNKLTDKPNTLPLLRMRARGNYSVCNHGTVLSQDTQYYTVDIKCGYSGDGNYHYIESATLFKIAANDYSCYCDVTTLSGSSYTRPTHYALSPSFSITCTLTITRCPRSVNLLN